MQSVVAHTESALAPVAAARLTGVMSSSGSGISGVDAPTEVVAMEELSAR